MEHPSAREAALALALALALAGSGALAGGQSISFENCRSGTITLLTRSPELTLMAVEHTGIHTGYRRKTFENNTNHCIGTMRIAAGERSGNGYCRNLDPDGDETYVEWRIDGDAATWAFIGGTGKWRGIRGGGEYRDLVAGPPIQEGTYQGCVRVTGQYTLPD